MRISYLELETLYKIMEYVSKKYINSPQDIEKIETYNVPFYIISFESNKKMPNTLNEELYDQFWPLLFDVRCYQDDKFLPYNIWIIEIMFK